MHTNQLLVHTSRYNKSRFLVLILVSPLGLAICLTLDPALDPALVVALDPAFDPALDQALDVAVGLDEAHDELCLGISAIKLAGGLRTRNTDFCSTIPHFESW